MHCRTLSNINNSKDEIVGEVSDKEAQGCNGDQCKCYLLTPADRNKKKEGKIYLGSDGARGTLQYITGTGFEVEHVGCQNG